LIVSSADVFSVDESWLSTESPNRHFGCKRPKLLEASRVENGNHKRGLWNSELHRRASRSGHASSAFGQRSLDDDLAEIDGHSTLFPFDQFSKCVHILVDREAIRPLALSEEKGVELRNCPAYVREWVARERTATGGEVKDPKREEGHDIEDL